MFDFGIARSQKRSIFGSASVTPQKPSHFPLIAARTLGNIAPSMKHRDRKSDAEINGRVWR
jgi:hypothetical protein